MIKKGRLDTIIVIRLPKDVLEKLERIATEKGLKPSTLARMWLLEKLRTAR